METKNLKALIHKYVFSEGFPLNVRGINLTCMSGVVAATAAAVCFILNRSPILNFAMLFLMFLVMVAFFTCARLAKEMREEFARQSELTNIMNEVAVLLLTHEAEEFEEALVKSMKLIAKCIEVDQIHIWKNRLKNGELCYTELFEWEEGEGLRRGAREAMEFSYRESLPDWEKRFYKLECVNGPISSFPEKERLRFLQYGILSILAIPVFLHNDFWGFVSFDSCHKERCFSDIYVDLLCSASLLFVNAAARNEMTKKIREAEERTRIMLDATPLSYILWDRDLNVVDCNEETFKLFEVEDKKNYLNNFFSYMPEYQPDGTLSTEAAREHITRAFRCGRNKIEWVQKTTGGELIPIEVTLVRVDLGGEEIVAGYAHDMREHKKMMTNLDSALAQAAKASKAKGDFLSNMSHEIRTPLNAIIGMTAIGKSAPDAEKKDYALEKIEDASTHLLGVINDILDISKIEANKLELSLTEFDFETMLQKVVNVVKFRVDEKGQKLHVSIAPGFPRSLISDDQRLAQVITNLLSNAVKFTPEKGSIYFSADLLKEEEGMCSIQINVTDTGIGMTEEQQSRLFTSFEQAESDTSRKFGGTGLGLAISKSLVEMMGGSIWTESEIDKGATFAFTIQARRGSSLFAQEPPDNNSMDYDVDNFKGHCILLAEDVDINREIVQILLEPTQIQIDCAENGLEALRIFSASPERYDMIFMDVQMPKMDGYEATREIRALDIPWAQDIPIVAMTANVFREDVEKCIDAGMDDHLGKPLDTDVMLYKLRKYLRKDSGQ